MHDRQGPTPEQRARDLITYCDGLEDVGGWDRYIGHARWVARNFIEVLQMIEAERSARRALQAEVDRLLKLLDPSRTT